jgi:hypothetical protein
MMRGRTWFALVAALAALGACDDREQAEAERDARRAGERIEEGARDAGAAIEGAARAAGAAVEDAVEDVRSDDDTVVVRDTAVR